MKLIAVLMLIIITSGVFSQNNPTEEAQPIVAEGKLLYRSEMASWYGTDLFLENYRNKENIGGYFSYTTNDTSKCVFYSKTASPVVIGTISFDSTYNVKTAKIELDERVFTTDEENLYQIRKVVLETMNSNADGFFSFYENTSPNIIPLISENERKVYVITGPQENGIVIFGNDYLITFDKNNQVVDKKQLHKNILPVEYGNTGDGNEIVGAVHSHSKETGDFITATDICTLMLYEKYANWETYSVVSEKYLNIWNCKTNTLLVLPNKSVKKIVRDQEKRNKKKNG